MRHSLRPSRLLNHSSPSPVHSTFVLAIFSVAAVARAPAVVFSISARTAEAVALMSSVAVRFVAPPSAFHPAAGRDMKLPPGRGWNQLLPKSKKQRSDQLQEVMKRMRSRKEQ